MKIYRYEFNKKLPVSYPVVALGFFDGVHLAHRALILDAVALAREKCTECAVFTFSSEDGQIKSDAQRIYSTEEKLELISTLGVDAAIIADFSELKFLSPDSFVKDVLVDSVGCKYAVAGYNFRFGKGAAGDSTRLSELFSEYGGGALIKDEFSYGGLTVSATRIRELLLVGDVAEANRLLGAPYFVSGTVAHGRGDGRQFGFPTINTTSGGVSLRKGVYHTAVAVGKEVYSSVTNVGNCPTFGARDTHAETYILDYSGDIYGERVRIYFLGFLRDEKQFSDKNELIMQINIDKKQVIERNKDIKWQEFGQSLPFTET